MELELHGRIQSVHIQPTEFLGFDITRYNTILSNTVREVGLYEKQSSFYVQAKTAESIISGNVFFNGPRAGINANDGFGGGPNKCHQKMVLQYLSFLSLSLYLQNVYIEMTKRKQKKGNQLILVQQQIRI